MSGLRITADLLRRSLAEGTARPLAPSALVSEAGARPAAVVLPVRLEPFPHVLAALRASGLREHAGEVAFPGGKPDPGDFGLEATALRELEEELGLPRRSAEVLGRLSPVPVITGRYVIHPFVALVDSDLVPVPEEAEVERVLALPILPYLLGELRPLALRTSFRGFEITVPHFELDGCTLYGASACVFFELLERLAEAAGVSMPPPIPTNERPWGNRYRR